jgi:ADP-ribose pyrophosphatase YjhB (NUDIX family)
MTKYLHENGLKLRLKVRAVVVNDAGRVLLIRPHGYADHEWTLAGGGVEDGEQAIDAIRREMREELGVERFDLLEELPVQNVFVYSDRQKQKRRLDHDGQLAAMYHVKIPSGTRLRLQEEEVADARWFTPDEARRAFPVPKQRTIFEACLACISGQASSPASRAA